MSRTQGMRLGKPVAWWQSNKNPWGKILWTVSHIIIGIAIPSENTLIDNIWVPCLSCCDHLTTLLFPLGPPKTHCPHGNPTDVSNTLWPKPHLRIEWKLPSTTPKVLHICPPLTALVSSLSTPPLPATWTFPRCSNELCAPAPGLFHLRFLLPEFSSPSTLPGKVPFLRLHVCHLLHKAFLPLLPQTRYPSQENVSLPHLSPQPVAQKRPVFPVCLYHR